MLPREAGVDHLLHVGLAVAVGVLEIKNVGRGADEDSAVVTGHGRGPGQLLGEDGGLVECAVAVNVFQQPHLPEPLFVLLRVVAHLDDVQPPVFVEGHRHGAVQQRLGGHLFDFEARQHLERGQGVFRFVGRHARQLGFEVDRRRVFEDQVDELIGFVAHLGRKLVAAIGIANLQPIGGAQQFVDALGFGDRLAHARHFEVAVVQRRIREEGPRRQPGHDLVHVERHLVGIELIDVANAGHVAIAGPAFEFAAVVVMKWGPAAARHNHLDPLVEQAHKHRVVAAQRVADRADPCWVDLGPALQQVDRAHVIEDALHRARRVRIGLEVVRVVAKAGIVGHEHHVPASRQLDAVMEILAVGQSGRLAFAGYGRLMQRQNPRHAFAVSRRG